MTHDMADGEAAVARPPGEPAVCGQGVSDQEPCAPVSCGPRPRPGRPVVLAEAARRRLLFDAAARVFCARGYTATTTDAIAAEAGMSKKTLYQLFPSKLALFDALLQDRLFAFPEAPDLACCDPEEGLIRLLLAMSEMLLQPDRMGLLRLIVNDGQAAPELMSAFERLKMAKNLGALEMLLEKQQVCGGFRACDTRQVAHLLFGMTIAEPILQALVNAPRPEQVPSPEQRIRIAVRIFLRGLAAMAREAETGEGCEGAVKGWA